MLTIGLVCALLGAPPAGFADVTEVCEYRYTGGQYKQELFRYRLFVPRAMKPGERYPVLMWLHGGGEGGNDNWNHLKHLGVIIDDLEHVEKYRFFVLSVQCPSVDLSWLGKPNDTRSRTGEVHDMASVAMAILQDVVQNRPVDPDRVFVSGISSGGTATWALAIRYPEVFAAAIPLGSAGSDVSLAHRLVNIPIWVFHDKFDTTPSPQGDMEMVAAVKQAGGNVHLTLPLLESHDCTYEAFRWNGAMEWLLAQRRGAWVCWTPPGCRPWQWWHILTLPCALLVIVGAGWYSERRRRRKKTRADDVDESEVKEDCLAQGQGAGNVQGRHGDHRSLHGFTLIELMVVISIIGLLISLLSPAVQMARESARRMKCSNNLRQIGLACMSHETANGHFPTGGWCCYAIGHPDRGFGLRQPGGWLFNILPYLEQQSVYQLQSGKTGGALPMAAIAMMQTPLSVAICPSRREVKLYTQNADPIGIMRLPGQQAVLYDPQARGPVIAAGYTSVARTDYAANGYDLLGLEILEQLPDIPGKTIYTIFGTSGMYGIDNQVLNNAAVVQAVLAALNITNGGKGGVVYPLSTVAVHEIRDGTGNTYLCGEKYMDPDYYEIGKMRGDQWNLYVGSDPEIVRYSAAPQYSKVAQDGDREVEDTAIWGSAHAGGINMCFCDGSVRTVSYAIDPTVHDHLGNRSDGAAVDGSAFTQ